MMVMQGDKPTRDIIDNTKAYLLVFINKALVYDIIDSLYYQRFRWVSDTGFFVH